MPRLPLTAPLLSIGPFLAACGADPAPPREHGIDLARLFSPSQTTSIPSSVPSPDSPPPPVAPPLEQAPCQSDADCGYDSTTSRCGTDPRWNKQPPLVDQGIVCYCGEARACGLLQVQPVPCEGEESCALDLDPRPHPIRATVERPYRRPRRCLPPRRGQARTEELFTTCERTNICTLNRRECALP